MKFFKNIYIYLFGESKNSVVVPTTSSKDFLVEKEVNEVIHEEVNEVPKEDVKEVIQEVIQDV